MVRQTIEVLLSSDPLRTLWLKYSMEIKKLSKDIKTHRLSNTSHEHGDRIPSTPFGSLPGTLNDTTREARVLHGTKAEHILPILEHGRHLKILTWLMEIKLRLPNDGTGRKPNLFGLGALTPSVMVVHVEQKSREHCYGRGSHCLNQMDYFRGCTQNPLNWQACPPESWNQTPSLSGEHAPLQEVVTWPDLGK